MYRVIDQTGLGFKAHDRQFQSMRSACASGLHLRSCTVESCRAGDGINKLKQGVLIHADTNATIMLLPAFAGSKQALRGGLGM
jgi:hypothetical protein